GHDRQQQQPHQERQRQADDPSPVAQLRRQLLDQNGNEDEIIYAQNNLEYDQGKQADPSRRVQQPFHQGLRKRNLFVQVAQHLGEQLGRGGQHIAAFHPPLFAIEVGDQAARLEDQQTAGGQIPGLQIDSAESVEAAGCDIGQVEYCRTQTPRCGALGQQIGKLDVCGG